MKREVIKRFRDRETGTVHSVGSSFESTDNERLEYLEQEGFLKSSKKTTAVKEPAKKTVGNSPKKKSGE